MPDDEPATCPADCDWPRQAARITECLERLERLVDEQHRTNIETTRELRAWIEQIREKADAQHERMDGQCKARYEGLAMKTNGLDMKIHESMIKLKLGMVVLVGTFSAIASAAASFVFSLIK